MLSSLAGSGDRVSPLQSGPINLGHSAATAAGKPAKAASSSIARATRVLCFIMIADPPVGAAWMAGALGEHIPPVLGSSILRGAGRDEEWPFRPARKGRTIAKVPSCPER